MGLEPEKQNKMRKFLGILVLSFAATVAYANTSPPPNGTYTQTEESWLSTSSTDYLQALDNYLDRFGSWLGSCAQQLDDWLDQTLGDSDDGAPQGGGPVPAPEFDPAEVMAALTLLGGGLAAIRGRRRKK